MAGSGGPSWDDDRDSQPGGNAVAGPETSSAMLSVMGHDASPGAPGAVVPVAQASFVPSADMISFTKGTPTDSGLATQSQHVGVWGTHADEVWADYTGTGVIVAAMDDGFEYTHAEMAANYRTDLDWDALENDGLPLPGASDNHGTAVLGTIIADDNGSGIVGVAFDAQGYGVRVGFGAQSSLDDTLEGFQKVRTNGADVMNNSWGYSTPFADDFNKEFAGTDFYAVEAAMKDLVDNGRGGLGTNIVFAAGNSRSSGDNVNYHNFQNSPYSITVAAHYAGSGGVVAEFSNPGAAILVSAPGVNIWTVDRTGASGYMSGDFAWFSGTSAAAPVASGVVALMLEANPDLGWRDVQQILAYSAQKNDPGNAGWQHNGAGNWNGGGLHFSHDFGYGGVDARAAVRLAETWTLQQTSANMVTTAAFNASPALAIPATGTVTTTISVGQDISIEHVLIDLNLSHAKAGDLVITLISPDGTRSVLANHISNGAYTSMYGVTGIDFEMSSTAHWGENSAGTWTLEIQDTVAGNAGTLNSWGLTFMGASLSANDLYVFSDDFASFSGAALTARSVISDTDGGIDTLNLSMVTSNSTVNLDAGTGTIAGKAVAVAGGTVIEKVYGGDGDDTLTGNAADNILIGGRGNDMLSGGGGNDTLDGGAGNDTVTYSTAFNTFNFNFVDAQTVIATHLGGLFGTDTLKSIENFILAGVSYTRAALEGLVGSGSLSDIVLTFTQSTKTFQFTSDASASETLTAAEMTMGTSTTANYVKVDRDASGLTLEYLSTAAPSTLRIDGSASGETLTIKGVKTGLTSQVFAGDGDDTIVFQLVPAVNTVYGGNGNDNITGSTTGKNTLYGDAGNDTLNGGSNIDTLYGGDGNDTINGGAGNDVLDGGAGDDVINGGAGANTIAGGAGSDTLTGGDVADNINGGDGDDVINGGLGIDILNGGAGNDTINAGDGSEVVYGGTGNDTLNGDGGNDTLNGEDGNDTLNGGIGSDILNGGLGADILNGGDSADKLYGGDGNDTLNGDAGNDWIYGEANDDTLNGGIGADQLYGGDGNDIANGGTENDRIYGGDGNDTLGGDDGDDYVYGEAGADTLNGGNGNDRFYGGVGNDTINGDAGNDYIYGELDDDTINAGAGIDLIYGGEGNDTANGGTENDRIYGGNGDDTLGGDDGDDLVYGEAGNDTLNGGNGDDKLYGADGNDTANGGDGNDYVYGDLGDDTLAGGAGIDVVYGGDGADNVSGGADNDKVYGGLGNDTVKGDAGDDMLYGDAGDDLIVGGAGLDVLYGGLGGDTFGFTTMGDGLDAVKDFAVGDRLNITNLLTGFTPGVSDIMLFVQMSGTSVKTFSINADGAGSDFAAAFTVAGAGLTGQTVQSLLDSGALIANQTIA